MHEFQHHIDNIGLNGHATRALRNMQMGDGRAVRLYKGQDEWALPGRWNQAYEGKVYGTDYSAVKLRARTRKKLKAAEFRGELDELNRLDQLHASVQDSEFMTMAHQQFAANLDHEITRMFKVMPDQLAGFIATMRGAFVPF